MKKTLVALSIAVISGLSAPAWADTRVDLPDLGDASEASLSQADELKLGRDVYLAMQDDNDFVDDQEVAAYVNKLGNRLAAFAFVPQIHFTFFCVNDNTINAFAMPGGYVGVNAGLVLTTQSEAELASVMGHEIAHVAQHHIARMQAASGATNPLILLGTILAAALASRSAGGQGTVGALSAGIGLSISTQLAYSRDFEREADRVGMQYLVNAGFDARAMPEFFQRLEGANRYTDNSAYAFLRTHPVTEERISEAQNRALAYPIKMKPSSPDYLLVREKLRVLTLKPDANLQFYQVKLANRQFLSEGAQWYGLSRTKLLLHDVKGAKEALAKARQLLLPHPMLVGLEADIAREQKDWSTASRILEQGIEQFPDYWPLRMAQVNVLIESGDAAGALARLNTLLSLQPSNAVLYRKQAQLYADKDTLRYHAAMGNAFYFERRYEPALEQFHLAEKAKGEDFYLRSSIEARMRELEKRVKEEKK